jgi:Pyruvate/2-oxoacid:ferredoxin oxidoreductase delta subunit
MGPPICDEMIAFVEHVFTEEEAAVARHLGFLMGTTVASLARAEHRREEEIEPIIRRLAFEKYAIVPAGADHKRRYTLLPIFPGIFEMVLFARSPETLTDWHRRFAELFEALYETGYVLDYRDGVKPMVRFLSIGTTIAHDESALPTDRLEEVFDRFKVFGVGHCQCRMTMRVLGRGCDKPLENCTVMGTVAEQAIRSGSARSVSKQGMLDIKKEAEARGLVTWVLNTASARSQISCSCCGCCCHAMRVVSEFSAPGLLAPAHFRPKFDLSRCTFCGKCARACPMAALRVDARGKTHQRLVERCIGCGLCVPACDKARAVTMHPAPDYKMPYRSFFSMLACTTPAKLYGALKVWRKRR